PGSHRPSGWFAKIRGGHSRSNGTHHSVDLARHSVGHMLTDNMDRGIAAFGMGVADSSELGQAIEKFTGGLLKPSGLLFWLGLGARVMKWDVRHRRIRRVNTAILTGKPIAYLYGAGTNTPAAVSGWMAKMRATEGKGGALPKKAAGAGVGYT